MYAKLVLYCLVYLPLLVLAVEGPLKIKLINDVEGSLRWASIIEVDNADQTLLERDYEQLTALAKQGYEELQDDIEERNRGLKFPEIGKDRQTFVMTALLAGNRVYLTSTLKGPHFKLVFDTPNSRMGEVVRRGLDHCQEMYSHGDGHGKGGNCGEVLAVQMFSKDRPGVELTQYANRKVVTWGRDSVKHERSRAHVKPPCGDFGRQIAGCHDFLEAPTIELPSLTAAMNPPGLVITPRTFYPGCA